MKNRAQHHAKRVKTALLTLLSTPLLATSAFAAAEAAPQAGSGMSETLSALIAGGVGLGLTLLVTRIVRGKRKLRQEEERRRAAIAKHHFSGTKKKRTKSKR